MSTETATDPRTDCLAAADGRITFRLRPAAGEDPRLLLVLRPKKGRPEEQTRTLDLRPAPGGDGFHAVLEPKPPLAEGRWDAFLLRGPESEREHLRPGLRDNRALVDGGTREWPSPVTVRVPYTTLDGFLAIRAWRRTAHAEAGPLDFADGTMTVRARLHGAELGEGATAVLRPRGSKDTARTFPVRPVADGGLAFTVDCRELVAGESGARVWNVFLRPAAGAAPVRVARLLDDLADRKAAFVYPQLTVGGAVVRPYYTIDNDLSVDVKPAD